ncbi:sugar 3,4-ketoisomerase [Cetobacterium sp.]|uniref:sugar 3,4-ketoisomerase n=1 Tax=Cetobacterium sp. TaxID=2071632 RepID=UPI003F3AFE02
MKYIKQLNIKKIEDISGSLSFFEKGNEIDFDIKRIYFIYEFNQNNKRGFHAHKNLKQVIWCPFGEIEIKFRKGKNVIKYTLDSPTKILVVNRGYWREFISLKPNSILCVGASDIYNEADYIRDYDKYLKWMEDNYNDENTF